MRGEERGRETEKREKDRAGERENRGREGERELNYLLIIALMHCTYKLSKIN